MADVRALYQASILEHSKRPRNFGKLGGDHRRVFRENPLCGDHIALYVKVEGARIADLAFEGEGCALSVASASMMSEMLKGKTVADAQALSESFAALLRKSSGSAELGPLAAFAPIVEFPGRVECARLAWHALAEALRADQGSTSSSS
jgi:nitrogen fixation NifU-like protein